jgi:hypothetical protein
VAALAAALAAGTFAAAASGAPAPVLGSPHYIDGAGAEGFGTVAPRTIYNGGVPSGRVSRIEWTGWGRPTARAHATGNIYRPGGGYFPPLSVRLRASRLGVCTGRSRLAYRALEFRAPQWPGGPLGPWTKWSGSRTMCDYNDQDPAYQYPRRPLGYCADVGRYDKLGTVQSIEAYRLSCRTARAAARVIGRRFRSGGCAKAVCSVQAGSARCRVRHWQHGDITGGGVRLARVVCRRGAGTMSAFLVFSREG